MIQRIQTLWLVAVLTLSVISFFFPIAMLEVDVKEETVSFAYFLFPKEKETLFQPAYLLIILQALIFFITLVTIFLYKKRMLQVRILAFALLCCIFYFGYIFLFAAETATKNIPQGLSLIGSSYGLTAYFPIVQIFFIYFAQKAIKRDEIKVRTSDRLR